MALRIGPHVRDVDGPANIGPHPSRGLHDARDAFSFMWRRWCGGVTLGLYTARRAVGVAVCVHSSCPARLPFRARFAATVCCDTLSPVPCACPRVESDWEFRETAVARAKPHCSLVAIIGCRVRSPVSNWVPVPVPVRPDRGRGQSRVPRRRDSRVE